MKKNVFNLILILITTSLVFGNEFNLTDDQINLLPENSTVADVFTKEINGKLISYIKYLDAEKIAHKLVVDENGKTVDEEKVLKKISKKKSKALEKLLLSLNDNDEVEVNVVFNSSSEDEEIEMKVLADEFYIDGTQTVLVNGEIK